MADATNKANVAKEAFEANVADKPGGADVADKPVKAEANKADELD